MKIEWPEHWVRPLAMAWRLLWFIPYKLAIYWLALVTLIMFGKNSWEFSHIKEELF